MLPALGAGVATIALTLGLGMSAMKLLRQGNEVLAVLGRSSAYFDIRKMQTFTGETSFSHALVAALVSGVVVAILLLLVTLTTRRSASRGLLFFAAWGVTGIAAVVASLIVGTGMEHQHLDFVGVATMVDPAAGWGILLGWIPALIAIALRIGRSAKV